MPLPNLIIGGPPKTGTTSIFDWLSKHPDVCASREKETSYFSDYISKVNEHGNFITHGLSKYENLFSHHQNEKIIVEATPEYVFSKIALQEIPKLESKPRVIFIYRNTIERLLSEYLFHKHKTKKFTGSLAEYYKRKIALDKMDATSYLDRWQSHYGNLSIFFFEDLKKDSRQFMKRLCELVGISKDFYDKIPLDKKNVTLNIRHRKLHGLALRIAQNSPDWFRRSLSPLYFLMNTSDTPSLNIDDREFYDKLLAELGTHDQQFISKFSDVIVRI